MMLFKVSKSYRINSLNCKFSPSTCQSLYSSAKFDSSLFPIILAIKGLLKNHVNKLEFVGWLV